MELRLGFDTAERVASLANAASHDDGRPILNSVWLRASGGMLHVSATDSYRLGVGNFPLHNQDAAYVNTFSKKYPDGVLADATAFQTALVEQVKAQRPEAKFARENAYVIVRIEETIQVVSDRGFTRVDIRDGKFPNTDRFIAELPKVVRQGLEFGGKCVSSGALAGAAEKVRMKPAEATGDFLGGFNTEYVMDMAKVVGRTKGLRSQIPIIPFLREPGKPVWFLWAFPADGTQNARGNAGYLLMPFRL